MSFYQTLTRLSEKRFKVLCGIKEHEIKTETDNSEIEDDDELLIKVMGLLNKYLVFRPQNYDLDLYNGMYVRLEYKNKDDQWGEETLPLITKALDDAGICYQRLNMDKKPLTMDDREGYLLLKVLGNPNILKEMVETTTSGDVCDPDMQVKMSDTNMVKRLNDNEIEKDDTNEAVDAIDLDMTDQLSLQDDDVFAEYLNDRELLKQMYDTIDADAKVLFIEFANMFLNEFQIRRIADDNNIKNIIEELEKDIYDYFAEFILEGIAEYQDLLNAFVVPNEEVADYDEFKEETTDEFLDGKLAENEIDIDDLKEHIRVLEGMYFHSNAEYKAILENELNNISSDDDIEDIKESIMEYLNDEDPDDYDEATDLSYQELDKQYTEAVKKLAEKLEIESDDIDATDIAIECLAKTLDEAGLTDLSRLRRLRKQRNSASGKMASKKRERERKSSKGRLEQKKRKKYAKKYAKSHKGQLKRYRKQYLKKVKKMGEVSQVTEAPRGFGRSSRFSFDDDDDRQTQQDVRSKIYNKQKDYIKKVKDDAKSLQKRTLARSAKAVFNNLKGGGKTAVDMASKMGNNISSIFGSRNSTLERVGGLLALFGNAVVSGFKLVKGTIKTLNDISDIVFEDTDAINTELKRQIRERMLSDMREDPQYVAFIANGLMTKQKRNITDDEAISEYEKSDAYKEALSDFIQYAEAQGLEFTDASDAIKEFKKSTLYQEGINDYKNEQSTTFGDKFYAVAKALGFEGDELEEFKRSTAGADFEKAVEFDPTELSKTIKEQREKVSDEVEDLIRQSERERELKKKSKSDDTDDREKRQNKQNKKQTNNTDNTDNAEHKDSQEGDAEKTKQKRYIDRVKSDIENDVEVSDKRKEKARGFAKQLGVKVDF